MLLDGYEALFLALGLQYRIGMRQENNNKLIAGLLLLAGVALLFKTCSSSDPIDLKNPNNSVKPQRKSVV